MAIATDDTRASLTRAKPAIQRESGTSAHAARKSRRKTRKESAIIRLARAGGLQVGDDARFGAPGQKHDISIEQCLPGWLTMRRPVDGYTLQEALSEHGKWSGPVKLTTEAGRPQQRIDVFMGAMAPRELDGLIDRQVARESEELWTQVISSARGFLTGSPAADRPNVLTTRTVQAWIVENGQSAAIDDQGNLRTSISHAGTDGQIQVVCNPNRLRFEMPLGDWPELAPVSEVAMLQLAAEANAKTRLIRIVCRSNSTGFRCRAEVDLTGLFWREPTDRPTLAMCRGTIQMILGGMALTLRRLGRELAILADPKYHELAQSLCDT